MSDPSATITADRDAARELRDSGDRGTRLIAGDVPTQALGRDVCGRPDCGKPVHLVNAQLAEKWVHDDTGVDWCELKAVPASRPWPEVVL